MERRRIHGWDNLGANRDARLKRTSGIVHGKVVATERASDLLHAVIESGDRVCIEGNNQKQADFLAKALAKLDPARVRDLHMVQSVLALPKYLDVFERGVASRLDFSFSGPQGARLARLLSAGQSQVVSIPIAGRSFLLPARDR